MINIKDSINNILEKMTQEQVDTWADSHKIKHMSKEQFVSTFNGFNKKGLTSLLAAISMSYSDSDEHIEKELASKNPIDVAGETNSRSFDEQALRQGIIAEYDAINLYEQLANSSESPKIKELMEDVAQEEKVHVGEFEEKLREIDEEHEEAEEEGVSEVEEMMINKAVPPGMRPALFNEKPDWIGPRGGKYKRIKQEKGLIPSSQFTKIKIDEQKLEDTGHTLVSNGNTRASIEETGIDEETKDRYFGDKHVITISTIESKISKTGSATNMIKQIQEYCNSKNLGIIITPDAKEYRGFTGEATETPLSQDKLKNWYRKLGFNDILHGEEAGAMYWNPAENDLHKYFEKAIPSGMRHALYSEKPDWIGPRGGKYVKIKLPPINDTESEKYAFIHESKNLSGILTQAKNDWDLQLKSLSKQTKDKVIKYKMANSAFYINSIKEHMNDPDFENYKVIAYKDKDGLQGAISYYSYRPRMIYLEHLVTSPDNLLNRTKRGIATKLVLSLFSKVLEDESIEKVFVEPLYDSYYRENLIDWFKQFKFESQKDDEFITVTREDMKKVVSSVSSDIQKSDDNEFSMDRAMYLEDRALPIIGPRLERETNNDIEKSKVYLQEGEEPPKGKRIYVGPREGRYYIVSESDTPLDDELLQRDKMKEKVSIPKESLNEITSMINEYLKNEYLKDEPVEVSWKARLDLADSINTKVKSIYNEYFDCDEEAIFGRFEDWKKGGDEQGLYFFIAWHLMNSGEEYESYLNEKCYGRNYEVILEDFKKACVAFDIQREVVKSIFGGRTYKLYRGCNGETVTEIDAKKGDIIKRIMDGNRPISRWSFSRKTAEDFASDKISMKKKAYLLSVEIDGDDFLFVDGVGSSHQFYADELEVDVPVNRVRNVVIEDVQGPRDESEFS